LVKQLVNMIRTVNELEGETKSLKFPSSPMRKLWLIDLKNNTAGAPNRSKDPLRNYGAVHICGYCVWLVPLQWDALTGPTINQLRAD
jgi:hypothetical protein